MNRAVELNDSDESDSDFCPDKEAGNEVSEEASTEPSSCSDEDDESGNTSQQKRSIKTINAIKNQPAKKVKSRKRTRGKNETRTSDTDDECAPVETERRRSTRQSDETKRLGSCREKDKLESDDEDKSRSDALWADFLSDVKPNTSDKASAKQQKSKSATSTNGVLDESTKNGHTTPKDATESEGNSTSRKKQTETNAAAEKIKVTEIVDFAGEQVCVEKMINADSVKENKVKLQPKATGLLTARAGLPATLKRPMAGGSGSGGLGSILSQIGKKKKISVLEKSQLDWKSFKQNEGIDEELQTFNKGKDGYLERQDFLQRTDLRQFEIEKNLRQSRRSN